MWATGDEAACWGLKVPFSNFSAISAQLQVFFCTINDRIYGGKNDRARPTLAGKGN